MITFDVHRMSTHDGPGLRTTLFLKGCSLKCPWCHNPESISALPEPSWTQSRCIHCRLCVQECPVDAISFTDGVIAIDRESCTKCGRCSALCPTDAIKMVGETIDVDTAVARARRDELFFTNSGGGVTISGGEPLLHAREVAELSERLREHDIHVSLDTSGAAPTSSIIEVLPTIDLLLFDLKLAEEDSFRKIVRGDLPTVMATLRTAAEFIRDQGRPALWIRTPIIPGVSDAVEVVSKIGRVISRDVGDVVERWELCAFNAMAAEKYRRLGVAWEYADVDLVTTKRGRMLRATAEAAVSDTEIEVMLTGMTRDE